MTIRWKKRKGLNPEFVLAKLEACKKVEGGRVSFNSFDMIENEVAVATMLDFGGGISPYQRSVLVSKALFSCAKETITKASLLKAINAELKAQRAQKRQEFRLLTTISVKPPFLLDEISILDCQITFLTTSFPQIYSSRYKLLEREVDVNAHDEKFYTKVIVTTIERNVHDAGEKCLDALNVLRSFLCTQCNSGLSISFGNTQPKPINVIRSGKFHTLHLKSGALATELYWFVPNYLKAKPHVVKSKDYEILRGNITWFRDQFERLPFKSKLKGAILRFVNAYDHTDYHSTLIMGWGSLESMVANEKESNNDVIPRRCSFLFVENNFHRQIIEHIREYRNCNVHYGESTEDPSVICYQLQRYFQRLIYYYLQNEEFKSLEEANSFLDLPPSIATLKRRIELLEKGVEFLSPPQK